MLRASLLATTFLAATVTAAGSRTLVAAHTIRAQTVLNEKDIAFADEASIGAVEDPAAVIGLAARTVIYQGRPIRPEDLGPPALIDRNQIVVLTYVSGALSIVTEGRALGRGGVGETIRVMNSASRTTVTGIVATDGTVRITAGN